MAAYRLEKLSTAALVLSATLTAAQAQEVKLEGRTPAASGPLERVVWALPVEPASLDPAQANEFVIAQVLANACESLFVLDPDFQIQNWLATSVSQPDPTTLIYEIRKDATFWDGTPVTPEDVAFSLARHMDPATKSRWGRYFANVDAITVEGEHAVKVKLKQPDVMFHAVMATSAGSVIKKAHAEAHQNAIGTPQVLPMCSGPFKLAAWNIGSSIQLVRNDSHWNTAFKPLSTRFEFKFVTDTAAQVNGLLTGELQGMYGPTGNAIAGLKKSDEKGLHYGRSFSNYNLIPNQRPSGAPLAVSDKIRQALSLAIDRVAVARSVFAGAALPTLSPAPSASLSYGGDVFPQAIAKLGTPKIDLDAAKVLVAQAGPITQPIVLAYGARSDYQLLATLIQDAGRKIGVPIELKSVPYGQYVAGFFDAKLRDYDMLMMTKNVNMTEPLDFYSVFTPSFDALNFGRYQNKDVIDALAKARAETDPAARARLITSVQDIIVSDKAWIPLVEFTNTVYMHRSVTGAPASYVFPYYPWAAGVGAAAR